MGKHDETVKIDDEYKPSDGDTSSLRKALTQKTSVIIPLGAVIAGIFTVLAFAGAWGLWVTGSLRQLQSDLELVKAVVNGLEKR